MKTELLMLLIALPILFAFIQARIAAECGLSWYLWFFLSIPLPLISGALLLWFIHQSQKMKPVENHELFDHLFITSGNDLS